jgi:hypothetical protein
MKGLLFQIEGQTPLAPLVVRKHMPHLQIRFVRITMLSDVLTLGRLPFERSKT